MFVRTKQRDNGKITIFIVENVRESGKVRQKTLRTVATVPPEDPERFTEPAEHIRSEMEVRQEPNLFPASTLAEMVLSSRRRSIGDESPLAVNMRKLREESFTTLYFESFTEDELRRFGYSKDHKFNQGQVLLALMVTREGLPVGYEVFPGNLYEGDTFAQAIHKIKRRYRVKRAVVVADSGLLSRPNIELLEKEKYEFILGARLKSLSDKWQDRIPDNTDCEKIEKAGEVIRLSSYRYTKDRRLIVSHSSKRAEKDRSER